MARPKVAVRGVAQRTREITDSLRCLGDAALRSGSLRPGWSRLTIACHLRFGAENAAAHDAGRVGRERVGLLPARARATTARDSGPTAGRVTPGRCR